MQPACGGSVQCCAIRVTALELDGVPIGPWYATDAITKLDATPVFTKGVDMELLNGCGSPAIVYKDMDRFKRFDLSLELIYTDPELENLLLGTELFASGGLNVGAAAAPGVAAYAGYYPGLTLELWSKHIVNGDLDPVYPYIRWVIPRARLMPGNTVLDNNPLPRLYTGYTTANANFEDGPFDDWPYAGDMQLMYAYSRTLPAVQCGSQPFVHS